MATTPAAMRPASLVANEAVLSPAQLVLADMLVALEQGHLFEAWAPAGTDDDKKAAFFARAAKLNDSYPGGLEAYITNARVLLSASSANENPMKDVESVQIPIGKSLDYGSPEYDKLESLGLEEVSRACFVLVAGGLGERLGYSGIKLSLPIDIGSMTTYLELYCASILSLQRRCAEPVTIPFVIMTSDDTHLRTVALLESNSNFGMAKGQILVIKQEKVAALISNDAKMAAAGAYELLTKPHGHGDVHMLLHEKGVAQSWLAQGKRWVVFFQDTNGLVFRSMLACLGVSKGLGLDLNSMCIPRIAKQEVGAITKLVYKDGHSVTANTEYNQLGPLLKALGESEGDVADETGFSPYPGNTNQLVAGLECYVKTLEATGGVMDEFVNPKYKDENRVAFKKPTRLECMMQDYAKAMPADSVVGFTTAAPWIGYSPAKNSIEEAIKKVKAGVSAMCPATAEADMYNVTSEIFRRHGCHMGMTQAYKFAGIHVEVGPQLSISPHFALARADLERVLPVPSKVTISTRSALVIEGDGEVVIRELDLDGALTITTSRGARVVIDGLRVRNRSWELKPLDHKEMEAAPEFLRIRGYKVVKHETLELVFAESGEHTVAGDRTVNPKRAAPVAEAASAPAATSDAPMPPSASYRNLTLAALGVGILALGGVVWARSRAKRL
eukprot:CAMPEP_0119536226 /NCGR_PEP_ID=MMETSP1344-20130328/49107_1 /TAXON_ID=236787 /ORGANISM="Florenciella parvula, Strain CCMP2471" /LENGTH=671 /DNA_ID=CAMNT_0007578181 /DNA_START=90 /DNA_END=2105 /DNA_ORIENTATION=-